MRIIDVTINGMHNPIGFDFSRIKLGWKVVDTKDKNQEYVWITIARDPLFREIVVQMEGKHLDSIGTTIDIEQNPSTRYYCRVEVLGEGGDRAVSETAFFETAKMDTPWQAKWIRTDEKDTFHPLFIKRFNRAQGCSRARIYISGLGLYEAYLNGEKIGDEYLTPNVNDYSKHVQYQTYDITNLLREDNEIVIACGNGFYKGRLGYEGHVAYFGDHFAAIAEIHMWDDAGSDTVVATDDSWMYRASDIVASDIYDGEVLDRAHVWLKDKAQDENYVDLHCEKSVLVSDEKKHLVERYSLPVRVKETLAVREVIHTPAGETVLDFGQNMAGFVAFRAKLPKGTKVILDFGEILQDGNFYHANYRTAKSQFVYISDGRQEVVRPHFTYFGFRYVRVTGWVGELSPSDFAAKVLYSDLANTMEFHSSDANLNRLFLNALWGQKSNFIDMPTDCPQRDERLGWTGDAQVFSPTASYQMDTRAFYRKYLMDLRVEQQKLNGAIPHYLPNNGSPVYGSSVWGDVATFLPMTLYQFYGDKDALADVYPMMKDWIAFIRRGDEEHGNRHLWDFGFHFGDWLAQDGVTAQSMKGGTDDYYVASVYYYASVCKIAQAAEILGQREDARSYQNLAVQIKNAILKEYFSESGRLCIDTQTGYLIALRYGIYRDKDKLMEGFRTRLKKDCYKIKGGFVGAPILCQTLAENGMEDLAYEILFQKGFPGWMHCIGLGATTIWERWNSVLDDGHISGTEMNSLNHYAYGSVMEYVYRYIGGLQQEEPGFRRVKIAPQLNARLQSIHMAYDSVSGRYVSDWNVNENGTVSIHIEVPFGCHATVVLPGTDGQEVQLAAGVYEHTYQPLVDYRKRYTMQSHLSEIVDDAEAIALLEEDLPIVAGILKGNDAEALSSSLEELQYMFFWGLNPQMVKEGTARLLNIDVV